MAKKQVLTVVKIQIPAGQASPAPPVGTALGPHGVAIMDFCKEYNARTEAQRGQVVPVEITIFDDRTFSFVLKTPPTAELIKKAANIEKGAGDPLREPSTAKTSVLTPTAPRSSNSWTSSSAKPRRHSSKKRINPSRKTVIIAWVAWPSNKRSL